ncbi:MAG TPA: metalloregulator ArsR/SmtB family transcription factor [Trueperaceae bacterium]
MVAHDKLAALSDPTRRQVFEAVLRRPSPVGRIAAGLPVSRPAVSQHLRVLLDAGLVTAEQQGTSRVYSADQAGLTELRRWIEELWDDALDAFEAAARKEFAMNQTQDKVAPITKRRTVPLPPERAFDLFTRRMGEWWPTGTHSIAGDDVKEIRFEGRIGGRLLEVAKDGAECSWGEVMAWNPPQRFVVSWHPALDPTAASVLEVRFAPAVGGGTEVYLEHRGWEEFGDEALELRGRYESGWDYVLGTFEAAAGGA